MLAPMTQADVDQLIADLNLAATLPPVGSEACVRGQAALAKLHAGVKLSEQPGHTEVIYLVAPQVMIKITCTAGQYHATQYDEQVQ